MIYWLWLKGVQGIGPKTFRILINYFGSAENVYMSDLETLVNDCGISPSKAQSIVSARSLEQAENVLVECDKNDIKISIITDLDFPRRLVGLAETPPLLFYKGTLFEPEHTVGIVGPRRCMQQTKEKTAQIANDYIHRNYVIISGLARGVDGYAHTTAIKNNSQTIAVVGCGLDKCYPKEHISLFEKIQHNGLIFSEYEPGVPPKSYHFPRRNMIIAALSDDLCVIDAGRNSGALITQKEWEKMHNNCRTL